MTNIVKKMKNVNSLALFTKLVGLAVVFSVTSCGCGKNENENLVATFPTEVKNGGKIEVELEAKNGEVKKLDEYKIELVSVVVYKDADFKDQVTDDTIAKSIEITQNGKSLKELAGDSLAKDAKKKIELEVKDTKGAAQFVKFTISILKNGKAIASADKKVINWSK